MLFQGGFDIAVLLDMNVATYSPYVLILLACLVLIWIYGKSYLATKPTVLLLMASVNLLSHPLGQLRKLRSVRGLQCRPTY